MARFHVISVVELRSGDLVEVVRIPDFPLEAFTEQFGVDLLSDPEMRGSYPIAQKHTQFLEGIFGKELRFDFTSYEYFLESAE